MKWLPLLLIGISVAPPAMATAISWERRENVSGCRSDAVLEQEVEARLGRPLSQVQDELLLRVQFEHPGTRWVVRIEMRDPKGQLKGERVLSVTADNCRKVESYVSLALALMIDPSASLQLDEESAASDTDSAAGTPSDSSKNDVPLTEPAKAKIEELAESPKADNPLRVVGQGSVGIYLYPAVISRGLLRGRAEAIPFFATARQIQASFSSRLVEREVYRVVERPELFANKRAASSASRKAAHQGGRATKAGSVTIPSADFMLIPILEELVVQDGFDYSLGSNAPVIAVRVKLHLLVTDLRSNRELKGVDFETGLSLAGKSRDPKAVRFAVELALREAADGVLEAMRSEVAFRIRPRFVEDPTHGSVATLSALRGVNEGDRFEFEDDRGRRSGYATVYDVGATTAKVQVWKSGQGRLLGFGEPQPFVSSLALWNVHRLPYGKPSAGERQRAVDTLTESRHLGSGTEIGLRWRTVYEPLNGSRWRPLFDAGWTFIASHSLALNTELRGGLGYQFTPLPALGMGLLPYVSAGGMLLRGTVTSGVSDTSGIQALIGATANAGATLEFYHLIGNVSLTATAEASYVLPLYSVSSANSFESRRLPDLHGLSLLLGVGYRPGDYAN